MMFDTALALDCGAKPLKFDRPRICGILNLTDDSFSGDGLRANVEAARGRLFAFRAASLSDMLVA